MKRWATILLAVVALWLITGLLHIIPPIVNPFDNPQYARGEASAMVERILDVQLPEYTTEKYLGRGAWEVRINASDGMIVWRVYETSGTVEGHEVVAYPPPTPAYIWAIIAIYGVAIIEIIVLIIVLQSKKARTKRVS